MVFGKTYKWITKVIESCETEDHIKTTKQLVKNYIYKQKTTPSNNEKIVLSAKIQKQSQKIYKQNNNS